MVACKQINSLIGTLPQWRLTLMAWSRFTQQTAASLLKVPQGTLTFREVGFPHTCQRYVLVDSCNGCKNKHISGFKRSLISV